MDPLPIPVPMARAGRDFYEIGAWPIQQKLHRDLPATNLYGYGPTQATATYPGMTIEATRGTALRVHWTNHLPKKFLLSYALDPTIGQAATTTGVPIAPHVHGGEQEPASDGGPFTWFTADFAQKGKDWQHETFTYANRQQAATLWYHDHAYGYTRFNPYLGLAGFYLIRDPKHEPNNLPAGRYEIPLAIQDKDFNADGSLFYPTGGDNPKIHPTWVPEAFFGTILANGKVWPYLNVEQHGYRFRFLDGSNARFYSLALVNRATGAPGPAFVQIGGDGGYLPTPAVLNDPAASSSPRLVIAPGERADVVIDFGGLPIGSEWLLTNTAPAPYPSGDPPDPNTTGQVMLFRVVAATERDHTVIPGTLNTSGPKLGNPVRIRQLTLNEVEGAGGPIGMFLNGHAMLDPATETPVLGTTEEWDIVNTTVDAHPIHLHLVQFELMNRQAYDRDAYIGVYESLNPALPSPAVTEVPVAPYLEGDTRGPDPNEAGWKDTFRMNPFEVTRVLVRFAPQDNTYGSGFAFDATAAPGYVWHCHILEHEENDMMRPLLMSAPTDVALAGFGAQPASEPAADGQAVAASALPATPQLLPAAPNPLRGRSLLRFSLPAETRVDLSIYNVQGQEVCTLASGQFGAGEHQLNWEGRDAAGRRAAPGMYFLRLRAAGITRTQRVVLIP